MRYFWYFEQDYFIISYLLRFWKDNKITERGGGGGSLSTLHDKNPDKSSWRSFAVIEQFWFGFLGILWVFFAVILLLFQTTTWPSPFLLFEKRASWKHFYPHFTNKMKVFIKMCITNTFLKLTLNRYHVPSYMISRSYLTAKISFVNFLSLLKSTGQKWHTHRA